MKKFVDLVPVAAFVERTVAHGAPRRVAIQRAARHYELDAKLIRSFLRTGR